MPKLIEETQIRVPKYLASMLKSVGTGTYSTNLQALLESQAFTVDDATIALLQKHHGSDVDISTAVKSVLDAEAKEALAAQQAEVATLRESRPLYDRATQEKGLSHTKAMALAKLHDHTRNTARYPAGAEKYTLPETHNLLVKTIEILNTRLTNMEMHLHAQKEKDNG